MRFIVRFSFVFAAFVPGAHAECDPSPQALNRYERQILGQADNLKAPRDIDRIAAPLHCIFMQQQNGPGLYKYFAQKYLNPLLGDGLPKEIPADPRYLKIANFLESLTLAAPDPVGLSVVSEYAQGDWFFYRLFCEDGDTSFCPLFLPDAERVKRERPLLAAASLRRLRKAYQVLKGKPREEVAERLRTLYREIPRSEKLQRRYIDQIYNELFLALPLGMA